METVSQFCIEGVAKENILCSFVSRTPAAYTSPVYLARSMYIYLHFDLCQKNHLVASLTETRNQINIQS
jgi:hypothetical protein